MAAAPLLILPGAVPRGASENRRDVRAQFAEASAAQSPDYEMRRRFLGNRRRMARSHALMGAAARQRALQDLEILGPSGEFAEKEAPVPGGVGYGVFYEPSFKEDFVDGTAIYWEIVCPETPGGSVSDYLYITATNRSALGVEAFVSYHAQSQAKFVVFDWALVRLKQNPWVLELDFSALGQYLHTSTAHGAEFGVLPVQNMSVAMSPGRWANQVMLLNATTNAWDVCYQFEYAAMPLEQHGAWPGSWGPIVETFEPHYSGTRPMGALNTQLANASGQSWGVWSDLSGTEAQPRGDDKGMLPVFIDPYSGWVVSS